MMIGLLFTVGHREYDRCCNYKPISTWPETGAIPDTVIFLSMPLFYGRARWFRSWCVTPNCKNRA